MQIKTNTQISKFLNPQALNDAQENTDLLSLLGEQNDEMAFSEILMDQNTQELTDNISNDVDIISTDNQLIKLNDSNKNLIQKDIDPELLRKQKTLEIDIKNLNDVVTSIPKHAKLEVSIKENLLNAFNKNLTIMHNEPVSNQNIEGLNKQLSIQPEDINTTAKSVIDTQNLNQQLLTKDFQNTDTALRQILNTAKNGQLVSNDFVSSENLNTYQPEVFDKKISILEDSENLIKNKNAEDASRQFVPERKSIFSVNKTNVESQPVIQEQVRPKNNIPNPYAQLEQKSIFNKDIKPKLENINRPAPDSSIMDMMLSQDVKAMDRHIQMPTGTSTNLDLAGQSVAGAAVFELSSLNNTNDRSAVIDQIQNYIIQAKASSEPKVEMSFHHQDLGVVDLYVEKAQLGKVSISITANSQEGMKFFNQHQGELLGSLSNSGIKVADFKLDSNTQSDLSQNNQQNHSQQTFSQNRNQDSKRREELWNLFKQNRDAA